MSETIAPKVFISYSWDSKPHKEWVFDFATRLRSDGVDAMIDEWGVGPGDDLQKFMDDVVKYEFILLICTPNYKKKVDSRSGGTGYEGRNIISDFFTNPDNFSKSIPVLRFGASEDAIPTAFLPKVRIDLRNEPYNEEEYQKLLRKLHSENKPPPPLNPRQEPLFSGTQPYSPAIDNIDDNEIELEFANQTLVRNSLKPSLHNEAQIQNKTIYALIVAPHQQGKTRVMKKLQEDYHGAGWHTEYLDIQETRDSDPVAQLLKEKQVSTPLSSTIGERGAAFFLQCRKNMDQKKSLAVFVDTRKISLSKWQELADFLQGAWRRAKDAFGGENLSSKYRVFVASRDAELTRTRTRSDEFITHIKHLPSLSYQDVSQAIRKELEKKAVHIQALEDAYSYDIFYLSGGYPGIIANIVGDFSITTNSTNLEDFLLQYRERSWKAIVRSYAEKAFQETVVNTINDVESVKVFAQRICVFRYFDKTSAGAVLDNVNHNKALDDYLSSLSYDESQDGLYDGLYTDGILRDLIALDMLVNDSEFFSTQCIEAKRLCLKQIETQRSALFISEYLFQSFQFLLAKKGGNINLWDGASREEIKNDFKKDFVDFLEMLKMLYPGNDRNDVCRQMRIQIQKALELHHIELVDGKLVMRDEKLRSFRFIVNFVYKQDNVDFESGWNIFESEISKLIEAHLLVTGG